MGVRRDGLSLSRSSDHNSSGNNLITSGDDDNDDRLVTAATFWLHTGRRKAEKEAEVAAEAARDAHPW